MRKQKFWFKNEKRVMKRLGFEPVPGSGSGWVNKEDGENEFALAQLKSTDADSYRLNYLDIEKLEYHAAVSHKIPVMFVEFMDRGVYAVLKVENMIDFAQTLAGSKQKTSHDAASPFAFVEAVNPSKPSRQLVSNSKRDRNKFYEEREKQWNKTKK